MFFKWDFEFIFHSVICQNCRNKNDFKKLVAWQQVKRNAFRKTFKDQLMSEVEAKLQKARVTGIGIFGGAFAKQTREKT